MNRNVLFDRKYWNISHVLFLLLLCLLCYWPFTFGIFSAKNDNITQFLPIRFNISEALRSLHLPLWSPYIYLGYPIHGDMQGGSWNPVVWLLSLPGRYDLTSLHCEILLYIFLAGAGMYRLLSARNLSAATCLTGAAAYMMCGYITDVGGSNLPFLAAAAYTPFLFAYYYHLLLTPSWKYAMKTAIALSLVFVSAYPAFFVMSCYILLASFLTITTRDLVKKNNTEHRKRLISQLLMIFIFLALSAPAIISYWEILPYYQRGSGVSLTASLENGFHPSCSLSFILPSATVKNPASFATDLISRNGYFNCLLLVFLLCYAWIKKSFLTNFILAGTIFFFLFSLGSFTPVRTWCYEVLPLMNTFRHPSNARLFVIMGGIFLGATVYQNFARGFLPSIYPRIIWLIVTIGILVLIFPGFAHASIGQKLTVLFHENSFRQGFKNFLDSLDYYDLLLINGAAQIIFLGLFLIMLRPKINSGRYVILFILNSFLFAQFAIPYTLVSKTSPKIINGIIKNFPQGFPLPEKTKTIAGNSTDALDHFTEIGIAGFYNKKIATCNEIFTPTFMRLMEKLNEDTIVKSIVLSNPYAYVADSVASLSKYSVAGNEKKLMITTEPVLLGFKKQGSASFELKKFSNNSFQFTTVSDNTAVLCLQQLYLPGWKAYIDKQKTSVYSANIAFSAVKIPPGKHEVLFIYRPPGIALAFIISIITFIVILVMMFFKKEQHDSSNDILRIH
jgi:hypothetical protein